MAENLPQVEGEHRPNEPTVGHRLVSRADGLHLDHLLLDITERVVRAGSIPDLFAEFAPGILELTNSSFLKFSVHDPDQDCMITRYWNRNNDSGGLDAFPISDCISGWVWTHQKMAIVADVESEKRFPHCVKEARKHGVRSYSVFPLTANGKRFGALGLGKNMPENVAPQNLAFLQRIASLVALAVENQNAQRAREDQRERLQGMVGIAQDLISSLELDRLFPLIFANLRQIVDCDYAAVTLLEENGKYLCLQAADYVPALGHLAKTSPLRVSTTEATAGRAIQTRTITIWNEEELDRFGSGTPKDPSMEGIRSVCNVPLIVDDRVLGALNLGSLQKDAFRSTDTAYLQQVANLIAAAIRNATAYREIAQLKDPRAGEKLCPENEVRSETTWDSMVGRSPALKRVLDYASIVANTDSTVLITGETGTGKERLARAIHGMSRRKERSFIKLNCAAIPTGLLESELFGHEKGAFTGAVSQKVGRLELADKGTLFLDEIGEIALELQPKLLRVLQDQEFERLGGTRTIRVDVRLISATNRDLAQAIEEREFRSDLFYRLHVFPLHLPALRDRAEDIPALVHHFVQTCSARLGRKIESIPEEAMSAMVQWKWPGNIRELENFVERSVILSDGRALRAPLSELRQEISRQGPASEATLQDRERDHIIGVLRQTRGLLSGPRGAAVRLGVKRTTLQYKLQKLGISRTEYLD